MLDRLMVHCSYYSRRSQLKAEPKAVASGQSNGATAAVRVAVLFAGRQASGGHNIIWGLHEFLKGTGSKARESQSYCTV